MVLSAAGPAAADDQRQAIDLEYLEARSAHLDLPDPTGPVPTAGRLGGDGGIDGLSPSIWGPFVPYAGFGLGKIDLAVQLETGELELERERDFTRTRLIAGVAYEATRQVSLGLEYLAVADNDPLFAVNVSGQSYEFDTRFTNHYLSLRVQYEF
jgi:hypothetical protein